MQFKNKKGFTLFETMIVIFIIVVLTVIAIFYYGRVIERVRVAEVVALIGTELSAQERHYLMAGHYTQRWDKLDSPPSQVRQPAEDNSYANGIENTVFYTRGKNSEGEPRTGYEVFFETIGNEWFMTANRVGSGKYSYSLVRPFHDKTVYCLPAEGNKYSIVLCTDFMGVDHASLLPADPRHLGD